MSKNRTLATGAPFNGKQWWVCLSLVFCLQMFAPSASRVLAAPQQGGGFAISTEVDLVTLPVTVTDRAGRFVSGLDVADFRVWEQGKPQQITLFHQEDVPVVAGLVVDRSGSMANLETELIDGARAFVHASNPKDQEFVVNFASTVSLGLPPDEPFTGSVEDLTAALSAPFATGRTALYDALAVAVEQIQRDRDNKHVLLLLSDGGDNYSEHTLAQVLRAAHDANVIIYAIGLLSEQDADQNPGVLKKLAAETGGQAYFPSTANELVSVCAAIAADVRHQYTLGFTPAGDRQEGYRSIRVAVKAPDGRKVFVRTRAGYFYHPDKEAESAGKWRSKTNE